MASKKKPRVTYEILRKDATWMAEFIALMADDVVNAVFPQHTLHINDHRQLKELTKMLKGATHIVIHDADQLPD